MLSLFSAILRHKRIVILVTAAAAAVSAGVSLVLPPVYVSTAVLLPVGVEEEIAGSSSFFRARLGAFGETYASYLRIRRNYILDAVIRSRRMSGLMIERFDLRRVYGEEDAEDARRELLERTIFKVEDTGVIVVGVEDRLPERARDMAAAYARCLDSLLVDLAAGTAAERARFLEGERLRRRARLDEADSAIASYMERHGLYDLESQAKAAIDVLSAMNARKAMLEVERELLEVTLRGGNPELERARLESDKLAEWIRSFSTKGDETGLFPSLEGLPEAAMEWLRLYGEKQVQEFALLFVELSLADARITEARTVSALRIIDPPVAPERRSWPKRKQIVLVSTAAGFLWVCFALVALETRSGLRVQSGGGGGA